MKEGWGGRGGRVRDREGGTGREREGGEGGREGGRGGREGGRERERSLLSHRCMLFV